MSYTRAYATGADGKRGFPADRALGITCGWIAAALLSIAFALAHWAQGWKSMVVIAAIALTMHALVQFTGTRVVAMGVHATYDIVAIALISREALAGPPALTTTSAIATGRSWGR